MGFSLRQIDILQVIRAEGFAAVEDLSARFAVTPQTIRRDINVLCDRGLLRRRHGGAGLPSSYETGAPEDGKVVQAEGKRRIAKAVAGRIPDGASLFIGFGTTTLEVARALLEHDGLRVVTNNLNVAELLCRNATFDVILAAGKARNRTRDFIGETAMATFRGIRADYGILGAGGIDSDGSLRDFDIDEVQLSRLIIDNSRLTMVVADRTKFNRDAPVRFASLNEVAVLVTDSPVPEPIALLAARCGVDIQVAGMGDGD
ncbi:DeoR/GlpR family DNA-binding transcription regulator [Telmatospirillum sp.]|uniref:DeoR/GlpR family DNA-binding transcription regulator n=1 Tax=Telmatospirillum sp. TaxID=2079197 RepID=UPI0028454FE7|nr:DeoR/GlpR family DNA-binding transcription regulator [Telmatospirillum sp.]MDR3438889.1 DeoR/GlpR family DNA-binding transcription regulator [Telmatospirillum sp.]